LLSTLEVLDFGFEKQALIFLILVASQFQNDRCMNEVVSIRNLSPHSYH